MNTPYFSAGSGPHKRPIPRRIVAWIAREWHWIVSALLILGICRAPQIYEYVKGLT